MNELVNTRITGCKFTTSAQIWFSFLSVVTGKSETLAYRIDLTIARSIQQGLSLRFSCNNLTLGY